MLLTFLGALVFVGLGLWFIISPPKTDLPILGNPAVIFSSGLASVLFFGLVAITVLRKLPDKTAGLIINRQGIVDNSSGVSAGLVLWSDIEEIRISSVMNQKFLMIIVKNPQDYISRVANPLKRKTMEMNHRSYGSPISISSNALQTNFEDLQVLLAGKLKKNKL